MKILAIPISVAAMFLVSPKTCGHPGIGLVQDSKGNIYYTDLKQIWKQTPDGSRVVAVADVHSHELYMDKHDNLFGEHLWYEPATEKFLAYQWCLKSTGALIRLTGNLEAYAQPARYSFVRDDQGNRYGFEKSNNNTFDFIKLDKSNHKSIIASGVFDDIRWMFSTPGGEIYFLDLDDLYKIKSRNEVQLISKNLCTGTLWTVFFGKQHSVFGVWFDQDGTVYAAVTEDKCIKKIEPNGRVTIIYQSDNGPPVNGLFDSSGNLWVLDGHEIKQVHPTKISSFTIWFSNNRKYLIAFGGLILALVILANVKKLRGLKIDKGLNGG